MANSLSPVAKAKFFDNSGRPAVGYKLFSYQAGTTTKLATYPNESTAVPNANPLTLDFRGEANVWMPPNVAYKLVFSPPNDTDPPTNPIWTVDNIVDSQLVTLWGGVDTGIANAYVLNFVANFAAYTDGIVIYWLPANTNTGASTINVNGLGPVAITNQDGSALAPGQIQANQIAQILYRGTGFSLLSSLTVISTGTFSLTLNTGFTVPLTGDISFTRFGNTVTLTRGAANLTGTSNGTSMSGGAGAIPASLRPTSPRAALCSNLIDDGNSDFFGKVNIAINGSITFFKFSGGIVFNSNGFTAANTKGLLTGWQISYVL